MLSTAEMPERQDDAVDTLVRMASQSQELCAFITEQNAVQGALRRYVSALASQTPDLCALNDGNCQGAQRRQPSPQEDVPRNQAGQRAQGHPRPGLAVAAAQVLAAAQASIRPPAPMRAGAPPWEAGENGHFVPPPAAAARTAALASEGRAVLEQGNADASQFLSSPGDQVFLQHRAVHSYLYGGLRVAPGLDGGRHEGCLPFSGLVPGGEHEAAESPWSRGALAGPRNGNAHEADAAQARANPAAARPAPEDTAVLAELGQRERDVFRKLQLQVAQEMRAAKVQGGVARTRWSIIQAVVGMTPGQLDKLIDIYHEAIEPPRHLDLAGADAHCPLPPPTLWAPAQRAALGAEGASDQQGALACAAGSMGDLDSMEMPSQLEQPAQQQSRSTKKSKVEEEFLAGDTAIIVKGISGDCTRASLEGVLRDNGFSGKFDILYLPKNFENHQNKGYFHINFRETAVAQSFAQWVQSHTRSIGVGLNTMSKKPLNLTVCRASVQGFDAFIKSFGASRRLRTRNPENLPWIYRDNYSEGVPLTADAFRSFAPEFQDQDDS